MNKYTLAMELLEGDYNHPFKITFLGNDEKRYFVGYSENTGLYGDYPEDIVDDVREFILMVNKVEIGE